MRVFLFVLTVLLTLLGLALGPLSLAAFASINPSVSDALRLLSVVEGALAGRLSLGGLDLGAVDAFWRGLAYLGLACGSIWLAAYVKPR